MAGRTRPIRFRRNSSVVVVGAHPDDAARACGGVTLRALGAGARITVVAVTDGAALWGTQDIPNGRRTAAGRKSEQAKALARLGVPRRNVFYLGFPDGGIAKLRHVNRTERSGAHFCPWLDADNTNNQSYVPGTSFIGSALQSVLTEVFARAQPTHVFTHHTGDKHPDHRGVTWFVRKAIARLHRRGDLELSPEIYEYLTYLSGMHWPPGSVSVPIAAARELPFDGSVVQLCLTAEEQAAKEHALDCFVPILGAKYINNWRRNNEVFWLV